MKKLLTLLLSIVIYTTLFAQVPEYQMVQSHGNSIYFRVFGKGVPLLIIGGGPGDNSDRYLSLCEGLSDEVQCILVDQRGTGKSVVPVYDSTTINVQYTLDDFEAIRQHLGLKQWNILGFSYGGYLASVYAHFYPTSVSSVVLLGSIGLNTDTFDYFMDNIVSRLYPSDMDEVKRWTDSAKVAQNPHHAIVERIRAMMPAYFFDREKSKLVSVPMKDSDFNFEMGDWIWKDIIKRNLNLYEMKPVYSGAVLILHGRQDPVSASTPIILSNYYTNSKVCFIEKAGHYSWVEQPDKVFGLVKEFLSRK